MFEKVFEWTLSCVAKSRVLVFSPLCDLPFFLISGYEKNTEVLLFLNLRAKVKSWLVVLAVNFPHLLEELEWLPIPCTHLIQSYGRQVTQMVHRGNPRIQHPDRHSNFRYAVVLAFLCTDKFYKVTFNKISLKLKCCNKNVCKLSLNRNVDFNFQLKLSIKTC